MRPKFVSEIMLLKKKIEWTIDAKSLPKQKSSKDSMAAIYIDYPVLAVELTVAKETSAYSLYSIDRPVH
ncbi:hypothetical protein DPMN_064113 [Dreissena polymorpha]|uniref:Uncharacterized protein n=1 Tax=Dreissena polymorpha TaxID=45954 RepID=A0A9D4CCL8_DREPO|nr:hypothetical protein DPMN_064113 [Dreissena polymorpha]